MKMICLYFTIICTYFCHVSISCTYQPTPCQKTIDSLTWVIKAKDYRLNRVRFYVKLINKKPNQAKFLKGWIKRAIN